jgi:hypothetical protein
MGAVLRFLERHGVIDVSEKANGNAIGEVEPAIERAIARGPIPMLEMPDSTGKAPRSWCASLQPACPAVGACELVRFADSRWRHHSRAKTARDHSTHPNAG